ncbi:AAA family ATPase [Humitalea sp. 24SJ18S-53]|uniref:AAA family ATPase n=1 Tax=Humitalea sp. 24SJ18S-53 TaxID=3422307 RepID=UPI003D679344
MNDQAEEQEQEWTPEAIEVVRVAALEAQQRLGLSQTEMGRQMGRPPGTLSAWLNGTYTGRSEKIAAQVQAWLGSIQERARIRRVMPKAPTFIETATASRILEVLAHAQHLPDLTVTVGPPGVGKSIACCHYTATGSNVWKLVAEPIHKSLRAFLQDLGTAMGLQGGGRVDQKSRQIAMKVAGSRGLIIIDEAQHLPSEVHDQLRSIHDKAVVGIALVGNPDIYQSLGTPGQTKYAQLHSRVGRRLTLTGATKGDVAALTDAWGVEDGETRALISAICRKPGALRGMMKTMRMAHMLASAANRPLTADDVRIGYSGLSDTPLTIAEAA